MSRTIIGQGPWLDASAVDSISAGDMDTAAHLYVLLRAQLRRKDITGSRTIETREALQKLEQRFPGVANHAAIAAEHELTGAKDTTLGREGRAARDRIRGEHGQTAKTARQARQKSSKPAAPSRQGKAAKPAARSPRTSGRGRRAWTQTGIPRATNTATSTALGLLGTMLGLTFLYLLLRNPKAIQTTGALVAGATRIWIAPVNPLNPDRRQQANRLLPDARRPAGPGAPAGPLGPTGLTKRTSRRATPVTNGGTP